MRLLFIILICIFNIALVSGCGSTEGEGTVSDGEKMINIRLYYLNSDYTDFSYDEMDIDQLSSTENIIDTVMNRLITEPSDTDLNSPVVAGMTYQRYNYNGEGNITLVFNMDYESADTYEMLMSKSAFTNTLCQIDAVNSVTFELVDLLNDQEEAFETYGLDSFAYLDDYGIDYNFEVRIYYPDDENDALEMVIVSLDSSSNVSLEQQVMEKLCITDDDYYQPAIEDISYINMVTVNDGVCYIDFTENFAESETGIGSSLVIYSIVNSLCTLKNVDSVSVSIDGDRQLSYGEVDLSENLEPDYSYVK